MKNYPRRLYLLSFLTATALLGCVNPYRANFNSTSEHFPSSFQNRFAPPSKRPRLKVAEDIQKDGIAQLEAGYIMIGYSRFDAPDLSNELALEQAKALKADVVLVENKFTKSLTETVTVTQFPPSEHTHIQDDADIGNKHISRHTDISTYRGPETHTVPKQVDYYEHAATFWRKLDRPVFGGVVGDLTDELKQKLQSNHGLVIKAVMMDSPAFKADLLKGDIILKINDVPVDSARSFYQNLFSFTGQQVEMTILRGNKTFDQRITLNE